MTTPLAEILAARIRTEGPMTLAEYMRTCLLHPRHGYYTQREALGTAGDFITAPEISQMFGELVGLALAQGWLDRGAPTPFLLVELGPGRGTLMADLLRASRIVPGFHAAMRLVLVEASPAMRARQRASLERAAPDLAPTWANTLDEALALHPALPLFLVANEFFDALPIRQFVRTEDGWRERMVGLDDNGRLAFGLSGGMPANLLSARLEDTRPGDVVEINRPAEGIARQMASRIAEAGGAALIVDYGDWRSLGDTFQALEAHRPVDPLARPGMADLTAHVDFEALARAASEGGALASAMVPQGAFLEALGIRARAAALARRLVGDARAQHEAALRRLTSPEEMGSLFKVMAIHDRHGPLPGLPAGTNFERTCT